MARREQARRMMGDVVISTCKASNTIQTTVIVGRTARRRKTLHSLKKLVGTRCFAEFLDGKPPPTPHNLYECQEKGFTKFAFHN